MLSLRPRRSSTISRTTNPNAALPADPAPKRLSSCVQAYSTHSAATSCRPNQAVSKMVPARPKSEAMALTRKILPGATHPEELRRRPRRKASSGLVEVNLLVDASLNARTRRTSRSRTPLRTRILPLEGTQTLSVPPGGGRQGVEGRHRVVFGRAGNRSMRLFLCRLLRL